MTLIILLLALGLEHFVGITGEIRRFDWFYRYLNWLENRLSQYGFWNGAGGVVITLAGPLVLLLLVGYLLAVLFAPLAWFFALVVLLYSLGPHYLFPVLDQFIDALDEEDETRAAELATEIAGVGGNELDEQGMLGEILLQSNERIFAVIFWFIVLGAFGALLYRLACVLHQRRHDIHGGYSDAARHLKNILDWPATRLLLVGNALSGNMVDAIEAWRDSEQQSLEVNESVLVAAGLGALNYQPEEDTSGVDTYWYRALLGMLHRTLILWLAILGLMTLAGWLS